MFRLRINDMLKNWIDKEEEGSEIISKTVKFASFKFHWSWYLETHLCCWMIDLDWLRDQVWSLMMRWLCLTRVLEQHLVSDIYHSSEPVTTIRFDNYLVKYFYNRFTSFPVLATWAWFFNILFIVVSWRGYNTAVLMHRGRGPKN